MRMKLYSMVLLPILLAGCVKSQEGSEEEWSKGPWKVNFETWENLLCQGSPMMIRLHPHVMYCGALQDDCMYVTFTHLHLTCQAMESDMSIFELCGWDVRTKYIEKKDREYEWLSDKGITEEHPYLVDSPNGEKFHSKYGPKLYYLKPYDVLAMGATSHAVRKPGDPREPDPSAGLWPHVPLDDKYFFGVATAKRFFLIVRKDVPKEVDPASIIFNHFKFKIEGAVALMVSREKMGNTPARKNPYWEKMLEKWPNFRQAVLADWRGKGSMVKMPPSAFYDGWARMIGVDRFGFQFTPRKRLPGAWFLRRDTKGPFLKKGKKEIRLPKRNWKIVAKIGGTAEKFDKDSLLCGWFGDFAIVVDGEKSILYQGDLRKL